MWSSSIKLITYDPPPMKNEGNESIFKKKLKCVLIIKTPYSLHKLYIHISSNFRMYVQKVLTIFYLLYEKFK